MHKINCFSFRPYSPLRGFLSFPLVPPANQQSLFEERRERQGDPDTREISKGRVTEEGREAAISPWMKERVGRGCESG